MRDETSTPWEPPPGAVNRFFDFLADSRGALFGSDLPPYFVLGVCGVVAAFAVLVGCALWLGLPLAMATGLLVASLAVFVAAGLLRKALGRGNHVLLQDVLLVLGAAGAMAWLTRQPVWRTVDLVSIALGVFLVFGRLGCLLAGCCHGHPARIGIRYRPGARVVRPLVGIRLFPLQAVEAGWIAAVTSLALLMLAGAPGVATWCWLLGYGIGRFLLEFGRGDRVRARIGPLHEAQWIAIGLLIARIIQEEARAPVRGEPLAIAAGGALVAVAGWLSRRWWLNLPKPALTTEEVAAWQAFLDGLEVPSPGAPPRAHRGPGGVEIALTTDALGVARLFSYSISDPARALDERRAEALAGMVVQPLPRHRVGLSGFGDRGIFHFWALVYEPGGAPGSTKADPPEWVRLRAMAFARAMRDAPPAVPELERGLAMAPDLAREPAPRQTSRPPMTGNRS